MKTPLKIAVTVALLGLSVPALAQTGTTGTTATTAVTTTPVQERGFDWGWLGLLGLAGLAGLSRREPERVHTQTTRSTHTDTR